MQFKKKGSASTYVLPRLGQPLVIKYVPLTTVSTLFADVFHVELNANSIRLQKPFPLGHERGDCESNGSCLLCGYSPAACRVTLNKWPVITHFSFVPQVEQSEPVNMSMGWMESESTTSLNDQRKPAILQNLNVNNSIIDCVLPLRGLIETHQ